MSERRVVAITEASDGFLCVATPNHIAWFDGAKFREFAVSDFAPVERERIRSLLRARDGHLWIASDHDQVVRIGSGAPQVFTRGLPPGAVQSLVESGDGSIWLSYSDGRLCQIKDGAIAFAGRPKGFDNSRCTLTVDGEGQIWFCQNGDIGILRGTELIRRGQRMPPSARIIAARTGGVWAAGTKGVYRIYASGECKRLDKAAGAPFSAFPAAVLEDSTGALWIGTVSNGLYRFTKESGIEKIALSYPEVDALIEDREGNVWVGTGGGGLDRVTPRAISFEGASTGLPENCIQSLAEDRDGQVWAATQAGDLVRRSPDQTWKTDPASPTGITSLAADPRGGLWLGSTQRKLFHLDHEAQASWSTAEGVRSHTVSLVAVAGDGSLWFTTEGPTLVQRLTGGQVTTVALPRHFSRAESMVVDAAGRVWIGADNGSLVRTEGDHLIDVTPPNSPTVAIRGLAALPDGTLWLGYEGAGLAQLRGTRYTRITAADGLYSDAITQVVPDTHGWLWCGGDAGVFKVKLTILDEFTHRQIARVQGVHFGAEVELPHLQVTTKSWGAPIRTHDGRIWMPMGPALVIADPSRARQSESAPAAFLTKVSVDNVAQAEYRGGIPMRADAAAPKMLVPQGTVALPSIRRRLEFEFTGLSFAAPENLRFRYRLDPFDDDWVMAGTERTASYVRVPAGEYRFRVQACNGDGVWNEPGAALTVTIAPFFWETWWFRGLMVAVAALGIYGVYRWRVRRIRRRAKQLKAQNIELERRIAERTADLAQSLEHLKEAQRGLLEASRYAGMAEVATGVLHNIGNALNSVNVSATCARDHIAQLKTDSLTRVADLLLAQRDHMADFVANDPRGRKLPEFLQQLSQHLTHKSSETSRELEALCAGIDHIKEIVAAQQDFAHATDVVEVIAPVELIDYALEINAAAMARHHITVVRDFSTVPSVRVPRQKALQILVNLMNNAKEAMDDVAVAERRLTIGLHLAASGQVEISLTDQGSGIAPENLTRIFNYGFTTKKTGHGFGLHSSANSAHEMGGSLVAKSAGLGQGATFILSIPAAPRDP